MRTTLERAVRPAALAALALAAAVYTAAVGLAAASVPGLFLHGLCFVLVILLPGLFFCQKTMPGLGGAGLLPVAAVCGAALLMLSYMVFGALGLTRAAGLPCAALGVAGLFWGRKKLKAAARAVWRAPAALWLLLLFFAGLLVVYSFGGALNFPKPHVNGHYVPNHDALWSVGNAAAVQWGFPLQDIRMDGGVLHYHYFADAIAGLLAHLSFQSAWDAQLQYGWPLWAGLLLLGLWALARRLGAGRFLALLPPAAAALMLGGGGYNFVHFYKNPNGVLQSSLYVVACLLLLAGAERQGFACKRAMAPFLLAALALVWGKSTIGLLLLLGVLAGWALYSILHRRAPLWPLAAALCGGALCGLLYLLIFSKGMVQISFAPTAASFHTLLTAHLGANWPLVVPYVLSAAYCLARVKRVSLLTLALHAAVVGGALATALFSHYAGSQNYFVQASLFLMPLCITEGLAALGRPRARQVGAAAMAAAVAVSFAGGYGAMESSVKMGVGAALRSVGRGALIGYTNFTVSTDDEAAALWLKENLAPDEIFATNRINRLELGTDGVFHFYTALSERRCYMEGWQYALDYSVHYWTYYRRRYEVVSSLFALDTTYAQAAALAQENGIDYLVLHMATRFEIPLEGGEPVFETTDVLIYKVD